MVEDSVIYRIKAAPHGGARTWTAKPMTKPEIMTLEEVARHLRVSERTVYDWANKGEIPGGRIGASWRFRRTDIERWLDAKLSAARKPVSSRALHIAEVLDAQRVLRLACDTKAEALNALVDALSSAPEVGGADELRRELFNRESLMSTGIGFGVGVPHVRLASVRSVVMAVGVNDRPLEDYLSLDETPVRIICMVAAGANQHAEYLKLLAAISTRLKDAASREALLAAKNTAAIHQRMVE